MWTDQTVSSTNTDTLIFSEHISHVIISKTDQEKSADDWENKWKGKMLAKQYANYIVANKLYTPEMEAAFNHIYRLNVITYLSIPVI